MKNRGRSRPRWMAVGWPNWTPPTSGCSLHSSCKPGERQPSGWWKVSGMVSTTLSTVGPPEGSIRDLGLEMLKLTGRTFEKYIDPRVSCIPAFQGGTIRARKTLSPPKRKRQALVDEYCDRCLWFLRRDYYPATPEEVLQSVGRHPAPWGPCRFPAGRGDQTMAFTPFQRDICRILAENRIGAARGTSRVEGLSTSFRNTPGDRETSDLFTTLTKPTSSWVSDRACRSKRKGYEVKVLR